MVHWPRERFRFACFQIELDGHRLAVNQIVGVKMPVRLAPIQVRPQLEAPASGRVDRFDGP